MSATNSRRVPLDKRKRTEISCDVCRGRKQKCHKPLGKGACGYCHDRGLECVTTQVRKQRIPESGEGLGTRLALLESLVKGLVPEADLTSNEDVRELGHSLGILIPAQDERTIAVEKTSPGQDDERILQDSHGHTQYIGPGSSYFFMMKLRGIFGRSGPNKESELCLTLADRHAADSDQGPDHITNVVASDTPLHEHTSPADLPVDTSDGVTNTLVDAFFEHVHPDYPILHEASFRESYERWPMSSANIDRAWLCSLLCVFILGRRVTLTPSSSEQVDGWWSQARALLPSVLFTSSVSAVQALMLASLHLHNIKNRDACWTLTGAAVRISFAIGLHREGAGSLQTPLIRELRKRIWWTLYSFELMQVSSHDRPSAIENGICSVGCPKVSILGLELPPNYMNWSNRLVTILGSACRALRTIRTTSIESSRVGPLSLTISLLKDLDRWKSSLPAHLSLESITILPPSYQRPLLLMHLQYHYVVSLVSRSALLSWVALLSTNPRESLPEATLSIANRCIASGRTSCELVRKLDSIERFNAVTWWDIYYTYSSALILVLNAICDIMKGDHDAARESTRYLGECARLATKHLENPMIPATMRRWTTTIIELNAMAADFVQGFEHQRIAVNAAETLTAAQLEALGKENLNDVTSEFVGLNSMPYIAGPLPMATPPRTADSSIRNDFTPLSNSQPMDLENARFWNELHCWDNIENILLGDQRASWEG
jgi:hypothetical protein